MCARRAKVVINILRQSILVVLSRCCVFFFSCYLIFLVFSLHCLVFLLLVSSVYWTSRHRQQQQQQQQQNRREDVSFSSPFDCDFNFFPFRSFIGPRWISRDIIRGPFPRLRISLSTVNSFVTWHPWLFSPTWWKQSEDAHFSRALRFFADDSRNSSEETETFCRKCQLILFARISEDSGGMEWRTVASERERKVKVSSQICLLFLFVMSFYDDVVNRIHLNSLSAETFEKFCQKSSESFFIKLLSSTFHCHINNGRRRPMNIVIKVNKKTTTNSNLKCSFFPLFLL